MTRAGQIVILNGAPRSGKSSIVAAIQQTFTEPWVNLGVDVYLSATPERYQPGIGLRPGGERPDLEPMVEAMYAALYESVAAHSRLGLSVVVDVGHHDAYSAPRHILPKAAVRLAGHPVLFVGVRCPIEVIMQRRDAGDPSRARRYATSTTAGAIPDAALRWQHAVHDPGIYDLEVDTSVMTPEACAQAIASRLARAPAPSAFRDLAASYGGDA